MRLRRALDEIVVDGIETTLPLFRALVREPAIIDGDYHIHWLEQYLAAGRRQDLTAAARQRTRSAAWLAFAGMRSSREPVSSSHRKRIR